MELVAHDTTNPPGHTREIVDWIDTALREVGIETERFAVEDRKPNLLATVPGATDQRLLYSGHLDTVPYDPDGWSFDPLGEQVDERVYGRGTTDMKGAVAAMIEVARYYAHRDRQPPVTLEFAFVSDEEVAGDAGVKALLDDDRLDTDGCVIGEPTCTGGPASIIVADRGSIWLTLESVGEAAHGSRPMRGQNAIDRLWMAITDLRERLANRELTVPPDIETIVAESVEYYADSMGYEAASRLFESPTVNLGTIDGGKAINSVPRAASAGLDVRLTAGVRTPELLDEIHDWIDEHEDVTVADVSWSIGSYEPLESPLVGAVGDVAESVLDDRVYRRSATGGGDAKRLREAGIPTVEFAVATDTAHACDEFTTVSALSATAEAYLGIPHAVSD
nr:M20/M25/M40 family metallo-hydrolase [Natranaeroarchaeum aerophilus]